MRLWICLAILFAARGAAADGLDLPMLYSARHAGMGGAAVGWVDDPSALFHNPAGLVRSDGLALLVDVSTFVASLQTSPGWADQNLSSGDAVAPVPMAAVGYRLSPRVGAGIAFYPAGAAGGDFRYANSA